MLMMYVKKHLDSVMTIYASSQTSGGGRCHCTQLRKASRRISQLYDETLAPSGLKTTQRAILAEIARSQPMTMGALAQAMVMDAGGLAHTLKPLHRDGLVEIGVDPDDRRSRRITITVSGRAKLTASDALWDAAQHGFEEVFGAQPSAALRAALEVLAASDFVDRFEQSLAQNGVGRS
ncbi:MarR family winged helix-turn-helix transcriptional regulator [Salinisphaera aquimarina]